MWGLTTDQWLYLLIAYIVGMVGFVLFFKIRGRGKMKVLVLKPSMQYEVLAASTETNKLKMDKTWTPTFEPQNIFEEKKPFWKFWRNPIRLVLMPEQSTKALGWKTGEGNPGTTEFSELASKWTKTEIVKFIQKEVLKARMASKPMSNMMFFVLMAMQVGVLFLVYLGFKGAI